MTRNRMRDKENVASLLADGWQVLVVWQCELKRLDILTNKLHDFLEKR